MNDGMKAFSEGTSRLSGSLFLLIALGFALGAIDVVHAPRFFDDAREDWGRAAPAWVWLLRVWALVGATVIGLFFVVQFVIAFFPYRATARSLVADKGWGTSTGRVEVAAGIVCFAALAAIALPLLVGLILLADGTVGNALLLMQPSGGIDIQ
jgi:hypothetical protein